MTELRSGTPLPCIGTKSDNVLIYIDENTICVYPVHVILHENSILFVYTPPDVSPWVAVRAPNARSTPLEKYGVPVHLFDANPMLATEPVFPCGEELQATSDVINDSIAGRLVRVEYLLPAKDTLDENVIA